MAYRGHNSPNVGPRGQGAVNKETGEKYTREELEEMNNIPEENRDKNKQDNTSNKGSSSDDSSSNKDVPFINDNLGTADLVDKRDELRNENNPGNQEHLNKVQQEINDRFNTPGSDAGFDENGNFDKHQYNKDITAISKPYLKANGMYDVDKMKKDGVDPYLIQSAASANRVHNNELRGTITNMPSPAPKTTPAPNPNPTPTPQPETPRQPTPEEIMSTWQSGNTEELSGWKQGPGGFYRTGSTGVMGGHYSGGEGRGATASSQNLRTNALSTRQGEGVDLAHVQVDPSDALGAPGSNSIVGTKVGGAGTVANGIGPRPTKPEGGSGSGGGRFAFDSSSSAGGNWDEFGLANKSTASLGLDNGNANGANFNRDTWNQGLKGHATTAVSDQKAKSFLKASSTDPVMRKIATKIVGRMHK